MTNRKPFFDAIRASLFKQFTQSQVDGLNAILDAWDRWAPGSSPEWIAYSLATAYHETARTMQPIREYGRGQGKKYPPYYGRGYVQLTWQANYRKATDELHKRKILKPELDMVKTPDLALHPAIAAPVLIFGMIEGWFTGKSLSTYFRGSVSDPVGARKIINGTDRDKLIAGYHTKFLAAVKKLSPVEPVQQPKPVVPPVETWQLIVPEITGRIRAVTAALKPLLKEGDDAARNI